MKNTIKLILAITLLATLFQSCIKEPINQPPSGVEAPEIPPMEMYSMPTEALRTTNTDTSAASNAGTTYYNWLHAGTNLAVWTLVAYVNIAPPTAAFQRAFHEQAQYINNNTFQWKYVHNDQNGKSYEIELTGQYIANFQEVEWKLIGSEIGGFSNFTWFTGTTKIDFSSGTFTLNKDPFNPKAYLQMDFDKTSPQEASLRFTSIEPGSNGNYIEYRTNLNNYLNKEFDLMINQTNLLEIQWNEASRDGRVKHPQRFNDSDWHCWNSDQLDIQC